MKVEVFVVGMVGTNCYLVRNEELKEMFIVDPGDAPDYLVRHVKESGFTVKGILCTHGHFDHILGINGFLEEFDVPVYAFEKEKELLESEGMNFSETFKVGCTYMGANYVNDGDVLNLAGFQVRVIHTPGHTAGGCCYYVLNEGAVFTGDTLFRRDVGRWDLPTGDITGKTLIASVKEKLFVLPEETVVYPGHGEGSVIGEEKRLNPYVR